MSRSWKEVCDSWGVTEGSLPRALYYIAAQLEDEEGANYIPEAGAHVRALRKSLPVQGKRMPDSREHQGEEHRLLLGAAQHLLASRWRPKDKSTAYHIRCAERLLRTWQKRHLRTINDAWDVRLDGRASLPSA